MNFVIRKIGRQEFLISKKEARHGQKVYKRLVVRLSEEQLKEWSRLTEALQVTIVFGGMLSGVIMVIFLGGLLATAASEKPLITGNLKYDLPVPEGIVETAAVWRRDWGGRPVWIAASTHPDEEAAVLEAHRGVLASDPRALLLWAPCGVIHATLPATGSLAGSSINESSR